MREFSASSSELGTLSPLEYLTATAKHSINMHDISPNARFVQLNSQLTTARWHNVAPYQSNTQT
jgi:hypothetical protein